MVIEGLRAIQREHGYLPTEALSALAQRINRWIVDGDDGDVAVATQTDWIVQDRFLALLFL